MARHQREPIELVPVFTHYVMILAAIPAIASMLLLMAFGLFFAAIQHGDRQLHPVAGRGRDRQDRRDPGAEIRRPDRCGCGAEAGGLRANRRLGSQGRDHRADPGQPGGADRGVLLALYPVSRRTDRHACAAGKALTFTLAVIGVAIVVQIAVRLLTGVFI